jgi:hypothetical protein
MALQGHQGPIVETSPLELAIIDLEAQGLHQVQLRASGRAGAGNAACVGWNLGLK